MIFAMFVTFLKNHNVSAVNHILSPLKNKSEQLSAMF